MRIEIPSQLKAEGVRFVLLERGGKKPFQAGWQNKNIFFDDPQLISHLNMGGNYGVMGGGINNLVIVDFDNEVVQEDACKCFPETFTVKTGSGLLHKYFYCNISESFKIFDEQMNTLADIQGDGKQVVGPGSKHPNGNYYKVVDNKDIARIDYSELKAIMMFFDKKPHKTKDKIETPKQELNDDFLEIVKSKLSMPDLLKGLGIDTSKNPTQCLFHSSSGGKCLGFNNETCHCFHCNGSWNIFSLIKDYKKITFKESIEYLAKKTNLEEELKQSRREYIKNISENIFSIKGQTENYVGVQPIFYDRSGIWWLWDKEMNYWKIVDEVDILNVVEGSTGQDIITPAMRSRILNSLKQYTRRNIPKEMKDTWVQLDDEVFDIETGNRFLASPQYLVTNPIPYKMGNSPDTPTMDRIFAEWVGQEHVKTLYEIIAYCMMPSYPINRLFCFIGSGMNGKSKYLDLLRKFIGTSNCCSTELDVLLQSRFEVTRLHKKLVCQMGETDFNEMKSTSILKKLTGGDLIGFEYKQKTPFEDKNYAKIIIATNNLPSTTDKTIGFYRRWMIIDFPNQFSEKKDILAEIPEEEYNNLANKCINILEELLKRRTFTNEGSVEERMQRYEDKSNPLEKFFKENVMEDYSSHIFKWEFQERLNDWCKQNRYREISSVSLGKKMKEMAIDNQLVRVHQFEGSKQYRAWIGLKWR